MCGITGIFDYRNAEARWPVHAMSDMLHAVRHRGPDGEGSCIEPGLFLGHARLAVIDLSEEASQPMSSPDNRFTISYNGEIYNFRALRTELELKGYTFRTQSDTEVLLAAWRQWGEKSLERLDGMFAFALYDRQERVLYLVRDHVGIKPLFYNLRGDQLFFASELLALFGPLNPCPEQDLGDLDTYFTFNYLPGPRTGLQGVRQLEAGCLLRVDRHGPRVVRYWSPGITAPSKHFSLEAVECFSEILRASVHDQTFADVPLGLFLSGGLDSYAVAQAAVSADQPPESFTLSFAEAAFDESAAAAEYARHLNICGHMVPFSWDVSSIERTLGSMGELLADASCFPLYQLSAFARQRVAAVLAGDGADELLAGYDTYRAGEITPWLRRLPLSLRVVARGLVRRMPPDDSRYGRRMIAERLLSAADAGPMRDHASFRRVFGSELKARLYVPRFFTEVSSCDAVGDYSALVQEVSSGSCTYLAARQVADLQFHLPGILAKVDRMSMAHGLEVRVPFLGRRMVDFCLKLDDDAKRTLRQGKRILRASLAGTIPPNALKRPKAGFLPPVDSWFRQMNPMFEVFGDLLASAVEISDMLDWNEVEKFWYEHRQGRIDGGFALLGILQYLNWSRQTGKLM